ncbi:MAG: histidinol-phosphate transaminase [Barnesiella sp.]|nr:histidinol-phosphate transaminase [Barnesiella sp.]MBD5331194.1 histidinol-phosphate transaminase [Bacteroides sp.]
MVKPLELVRKNILALQPYSTARDEFKGGDINVWLDANESPYNNGVNRYPDPHQHSLKEKISRLKGVGVENIFVGGAGSDEAIDLTFRIFCEPGVDNAVSIAPSYGVYRVAAAINDIELREVMLTPDFMLPVSELLQAADAHTKLMWICSPNNPTGNAFALAEIETLADSFGGMVVVDEAYVDFSEKGSLLSVLHQHPNLIILQTFSKAWGMAGLRVGMAFASQEIAEIYARVKYPYNLNGPTQMEVMRRMEENISDKVAEIVSEAKSLAETLGRFPFVEKVYPTDANFLLVKVDNADALYDYLLSNGVIVRNRSRVAGCEECLRFTIGTPDENARVINLLNQYPI